MEDPQKEERLNHQEWGIPLKGTVWSTKKTELGKGSFGVVYKVLRISNGQPVAIKEINTQRSDKFEAKKEAENYNLFNGVQNIVQVFDMVQNHDCTKLYIVLEFCNKQTLSHDIAARQLKITPYTYIELKEICGQVLTGLTALHNYGTGYCHLDLKPENIGIDERDFKLTYKLIDFGFLFRGGEFDDLELGTTGYKAPEVVSNDPSLKRDTKVDIFSFGCVLYELTFFQSLFHTIIDSSECVEGEYSVEEFTKEKKQKIFYKAIEQGITFPNEEDPFINKFISDCLQIDPTKRPSATECLTRLGFDFDECERLNPLRNRIQGYEEIENLSYLDQLDGLERIDQMKQKIRDIITQEKKTLLFNTKNYKGSDNKIKSLKTDIFIYFGQVNKHNQRHGQGACWDHLTDELYFGLFSNNMKSGLGCSVFSGDTRIRILGDLLPDSFIGEYENDLFNGYATIEFANNVKFIGELKKGVVSGSGKLKYYKNGMHFIHQAIYDKGNWEPAGILELRTTDKNIYKYEGNFRGDILIETITDGIMQDMNCTKYKGTNWTSLFDGEGEIHYADPKDKSTTIAYFKGSWKNLKKEGTDCIYTKKGVEEYKGDFVDDKYEGTGSLYTIKTRIEYRDGGFKEGLFEGRGTLTEYSDDKRQVPKYEYRGLFLRGQFEDTRGVLENVLQKTIYTGNFSKGKIDGEGRMEFEDKPFKSFEGTFKDEEPWKGKLVYNNKNEYNGYLLHMKRHGEGEMSYSFEDPEKKYRKYTGLWKDDLFDGKGTLHYSDYNRSYTGQFVKGLREGKGILKHEEKLMDGIFKKDKMTKGKITYQDGTSYIGEVQDNRRHGKGNYSFADGSHFTGDFKNDLITGFGLMNYMGEGDLKDMIYQGQFDNNKRNGEGELRAKYYQYFGSFKDDLRHGQGLIIINDPNSPFESYQGYFANDEMQGEGKLLLKPKRGFKTGDLIKGEFKNTEAIAKRICKRMFEGQPMPEAIYCKGEIIYANKDTYKGSIEACVPHGAGVLESYAHQFTYEGRFKKGLMHGLNGVLKYKEGDTFEGEMSEGDMKEGKFSFANGDVYKGTFKNFHFDGEGIITYKKIEKFKSYEGQFKRNQFHGRGTIRWPNGDWFKGCFEDGHQKGNGHKETSKLIADGDFLRFKLHGNGSLINLVTRDYYEGPFVEDTPTTEESEMGTIWFADVDLSTKKPKKSSTSKRYTGSFAKCGSITGKGVMMQTNGEFYDGWFDRGVYHGKGILVLANKDVLEGTWERGVIVNKDALYTFSAQNQHFQEYRGDFEENQIQGFGEMKLRDGRRYVGDFYKGLFHGRGSIYSAKDPQKKIFEGFFEKGKKHGYGTEYVNDSILKKSFKYEDI